MNRGLGRHRLPFSESCPEDVQPERLRALLDQWIARLGLDLRDLVVLTEAGTNHFALTPLLAVRAGATSVYAVSGDSCWGKAAEAFAGVERWRQRLDLPDRVLSLDRVTGEALARADIVTNLGWVRPLDAAKVERMREGTAISAMCEAWEVRTEDIDLSACEARGVRVAGVNEDHPSVDVFEHNGLLAVKMLLALQIEVHGTRIAVAGEGKFATRITEKLATLGAEVRRSAGLCGKEAVWALEGADALVVADYTRDTLILGDGGDMTVEDFKKLAPHVAVVQFAGWIRAGELRMAGIPVYPLEEIGPRRMGRTMAHLGPSPLLGLHAAGLKVGAMLLGRPGPGGLAQPLTPAEAP